MKGKDCAKLSLRARATGMEEFCCREGNLGVIQEMVEMFQRIDKRIFFFHAFIKNYVRRLGYTVYRKASHRAGKICHGRVVSVQNIVALRARALS